MARTVNDLHAMLALARVQDLASRHADVLSSLEAILRAAAARDPDATEIEMREHIRPFTTYFASPSRGPMER
jgi:DNA-binding GntR family transcriptional regulator